HEVHGTTRSESKQAMLYELDAVPVVADALDPDQVAEAVGRARPDVIVHEAPGARELAAGVRGGSRTTHAASIRRARMASGGHSVSDRERLLDELRPVAFAVADRMLGSVAEAEDVVQEALPRVHQALEAGEQIGSPRAFVATVTTRLAINELRSARARREHYVGEWLPEPIITNGRDDPAQQA